MATDQPEQQQSRSPFNPREHLIQLKSREGSKDYLPVNWRLVWFREQCPQGTIDTEEVVVDLDREVEEEAFAWNNEKRRSEKIVKRARGYARFKTIATDGKGGRATGTKSENAANFPDFVEKAETGSIGRALAALGYGTQFAPDLDEAHRIVDAPVSANGNGANSANGNASANSNGAPRDENSEASITDQQMASIRKLCGELGKSEPDNLTTLSFLAAKRLIQQLVDENKERRNKPKETMKEENEAQPVQPQSQPQQAQSVQPQPQESEQSVQPAYAPPHDTAQIMEIFKSQVFSEDEWKTYLSYCGLTSDMSTWEKKHYVGFYSNLAKTNVSQAHKALECVEQHLALYEPGPSRVGLKERCFQGKSQEEWTLSDIWKILAACVGASFFREVGPILDPNSMLLRAPAPQGVGKDSLLDLYCNANSDLDDQNRKSYLKKLVLVYKQKENLRVKIAAKGLEFRKKYPDQFKVLDAAVNPQRATVASK
jgi:hypothetical protein